MKEYYKRVERNLVKKGAIITYYSDTIQLPDGHTEFFDFLEHHGAAAVVPVMDDGRIIMVRQYRNAIDQESLEIPAGGKNADEDMHTCASRELEEETGFRSDNVSHLFNLYTTVAFCNEEIGIYLAENLIPSKQHLDDDEYLEVETYTIDELMDMIAKGQIKDAKTIAALSYYKACKHK